MSHPAQPRTSLVLITGAGRSGTSTIAGTFFHLGHHVPEPYLQGNESNPRGFYESWWPVRFHKKLVSRANVEQTDGRPEALDLVRDVVDESVRAELSDEAVGGQVGDATLARVALREVAGHPLGDAVGHLAETVGAQVGVVRVGHDHGRASGGDTDTTERPQLN